MGNSSSSGGRPHHDDSVDCGFLAPHGVYTAPRDWNHAAVSQLIVARRLAPFYPPLEEYDPSWDDSQILAARRDTQPAIDTSDPVSTVSSRRRSRVQPRPEVAVYRGAIECPICFLYYPPNINYSRCCDQAICTECFVQIKRTEPTATHLVSEPAACPYCVQDNFGIVYRPPHWRAGIGSDGSSPQTPEPPRTPPSHRRRQQSYSADSPEVVTTDQIRPDWEAKLAAVRAAVARRANRRIIMRQVGDRLIPVGVSSGRIHALNPEDATPEAVEAAGGSRRRRRGGPHPHLDHLMGQDFEEIMIMEAMRLSLIEHEEQQRKEAEERRRQEAACAAAVASNLNDGFTPQLPAARPSSTSTSPPSSSQASLVPPPSAATQSNESNTAQQQRISPSHFQSRFYNSEPGNRLSTQNRQTVSNQPFLIATNILGLPVTSQPQGSRLTSSSSASISPTTTASSHTASLPNVNDKNDQGEDRPPAVPPKLTLDTTSSIDASASTNVSNSRDSIDRSSYKPLPSSPESGKEIMNKSLLALQANSHESGRSLNGGSVPRQDGSTADGGAERDE